MSGEEDEFPQLNINQERQRKMKVETYEIEECNSSEASKMAADSEALELIEKLGLKGQKTLCNGQTATRVPYRTMTAMEGLVFTTLFPNQTRLEDYSEGIIPVRVLQIAAHARELEMFSKLVVWHPAPGISDPLLCGFKSDGRHEWVGTWFLLARWGEALESFEQLTAKARDIWKAKIKTELLKYKRNVEADLADIDSIANQTFLTGIAKGIYYHGFAS